MSRFASWFDQSAVGRRFHALERREQDLVTAGAAVLGIAVFYFAVWQPISDWSSRAEAQYARQLAVVDYLRTNEAAARSAGSVSAAQQTGGGSILTVVADTAAAAGIALTRYQNETGGGLSIVLQDQEFESVLRWLAQLERVEGRRIRQLSVDAQGNPGRVNARISVL